MNNLNIPLGMEGIRPGGADGDKWYCALLVPMLGLFGLGWLWKRESQREIQEVKVQYNQEQRRMWDALHRTHKEGEEFHKDAQQLLQLLEVQLINRQSIFCSRVQSKERRLEIERNLLRKAEEPMWAELNLNEDLNYIFQNEDFCAELTNTNDRNNGKLMWVYLKHWQLKVDLQKHKKVEQVLKEFLPNDKRP